MLQRVQYIGVKTAEEQILGFFAKKLGCMDSSCVYMLESVILAIHEWYFIPRAKILMYRQLVYVRRVALTYNQSGKLPKEYHRAYAYASGPDCKYVEDLFKSEGRAV